MIPPSSSGEDAGKAHVTESLPGKGPSVVSGLEGLSEALVDLSQMALGGYITPDDKTATPGAYTARQESRHKRESMFSAQCVGAGRHIGHDGDGLLLLPLCRRHLRRRSRHGV